jgi:ABC-type nitrate/sulfonate/bicarbonate transport system substrate-binding protein
VRVGIVSRTVTYWPLYLMARDGAPIELVLLGSTAAGVDALLAGRVDVAATCPDVLIEREVPLRIAGGLVDRPPATVVGRPGLGDLSDLRGLRVATTQARGSVSVYLRALLRAQGLGERDYVQVVCGPTPEQAAALERGDVDAAMLTFPFDEFLIRQGFVGLARVGDALGGCVFTTLNVRPGYSGTEEWRSFRAGLAWAIEELADPVKVAGALAVLAEETGLPVEAPPRYVAYDTTVNIASVERLLAFMRADGAGARFVPARDLLDFGAGAR